MKWMNQLERRWGGLAIPHLTRWIVLLNALGYLAINTQPTLQYALALDANRVLHGEVWRLMTYLFIPPSLSPFWIVFVLYFTYMVGEGLEEEWGAFKLNLYYIVGMAATTFIAAFLTPGAVDNTYLNTSLFFAFATIYPDFVILLFFILPVKVKWLALFIVATLGFQMVLGSMADRLAILVSVANYFLFFGSTIREQVILRRQAARGRVRFREALQTAEQETFHRCANCGRTEVTDPHLAFRVSKDGQEYCADHLPRVS